jgi:hypothetical protein
MKTARQLSVLILLITAGIALYGGVQLVIDPTGSSLGFPFYLLNNSIFSDYLLTGWILSTTIGVFSLVIVVCILIKTAFYSFLIMVQGVIVCIYVFIMILLMGEAFLIEYFFLVLGTGLIGLGALQHQRKIVVELERRSNPKKPGKHRRPRN